MTSPSQELAIKTEPSTVARLPTKDVVHAAVGRASSPTVARVRSKTAITWKVFY